MRDPKNQRGLFSRAELLIMLRRWDEALTDLNQLLTVNSEHLQGVTARASLQAQMGNLQDAVTDTRKLVELLKKKKRSAAVIKQTEEKLTALERHSKEWKQYAFILNESPLKHVPATHANKGLRPAYQACIKLVTFVIDNYGKNNVDLRLLRASCAINTQQTGIANADLKYVLQLDSYNLEAVALNAKALRALASLDNAKAELKRCLSLDPEHAACATLYKSIRQQQKLTEQIEREMTERKYDAALKSVDKLSHSDAGAYVAEDVLRWQCKAYFGNRDVPNGLTACKHYALAVGEDSPLGIDTQLDIADLHLLNDDYDSAERVLQKLQSLNVHNQRTEEMKHKIHRLRQMGSRKDYYKMLGVAKTSSSSEIHRAYRKLARELHPDKLRSKPLSDAERAKKEALFRDINEAKEVLLDEEKRARYDSGEDVMNPQAQSGHPFQGSHFPFNHFFHGNQFGGGQQFRYEFRR
ncbi:DnaJ like protein subfamily C member 3 [Angomonas deanei]|nr:DnaJ like protein subfamily C member 3 [Angomonas deanei]|eukprot:EPY24380.1 DnaJ like protein subfamily C member 3 [Angomonas deanei]